MLRRGSHNGPRIAPWGDLLELPRLDGNVLSESCHCCGEQDSDVDLGVHFE